MNFEPFKQVRIESSSSFLALLLHDTANIALILS